VTGHVGEDLTHLIEPLHRVKNPPGCCPSCRGKEHLDVYRSHVEWACGYVHPLPPLPSQRPAPGRKGTR
jgi:hypothetical protein